MCKEIQMAYPMAADIRTMKFLTGETLLVVLGFPGRYQLLHLQKQKR